MQRDENILPRTLSDFLLASRRYFGLPAITAPSSLRHSGVTQRLQPMLRSLLIIGSLGTTLAQPAMANDTTRPAEGREAVKKATKRDNASDTAPSASMRNKNSHPR